jgi:nitroreductase
MIVRPAMQGLKALVKRLPARWRERALDWFARHPRLVALYYLATPAFAWEQRAALYGTLMHRRDAENLSGEGMRYALRRSIHRIEKGLIMRPRRAVFAEDYVEQTVAQLASLARNAGQAGQNGDPLLTWAADVLGSYFAAVNSSPTIDQARNRYQEVLDQTGYQPGDVKPYRRDLKPLNIRYEDLLELARRRRSVRWYEQKPVPRDVIDRAIEVARWSPSACNRQPFEFRVFDEPELVRRLGALPMGAAHFFEKFPCLVVVIGKMRAFSQERDRHVVYIDVGLAAMAFQFALEVQGVSSCPINWPEIPHLEGRMRKALSLAADDRPVLLISLGYPDPEGMVPFSQKKSLDELRSYNRV